MSCSFSRSGVRGENVNVVVSLWFEGDLPSSINQSESTSMAVGLTDWVRCHILAASFSNGSSGDGEVGHGCDSVNELAEELL